MALMRFRISLAKTVAINWSHVLAFGLIVAGAFVSALKVQIATGHPLTWPAVATSLLGAVWLAIQQSVIQTNVPPLPAVGSNFGTTLPESPSPPTMRNERSGLDSLHFVSELTAMAVFLVVGFVSILVMDACSPAEQAIEAKIEQTILNDLATGKTLEQVETDVAVLLVGQPGADIVVIVNDALAFLIDIHAIPANILPQAQTMLAQEHAKLTARAPHAQLPPPPAGILETQQ